MTSINNVIKPPFNWDEVINDCVYRIRWRDGEHLYATRERAEVAHEWLALEGREPSAVVLLTGYRGPRRKPSWRRWWG